MTKEQEILDMIGDCITRSRQLSQWELEFIDSIDHQTGAGHSLTQPQLDKLEQIWERVTSDE